MSSKAIQFFVGDDQYSAFQQLVAWRRAFRLKQSDHSVLSIDGEDNTAAVAGRLLEAAGSISLFSEVRLVVIRQPLAVSGAAEAALLALWRAAVPGQLVVLNWQRGLPDKRRRLYKEAERLVKEGLAVWQLFLQPSLAERGRWLNDLWRRLQVSAEPAAVEQLLARTAGQPLGILAQCAELLATVATATATNTVTADSVNLYTPQFANADTFGVTDALAAGRLDEALRRAAPITMQPTVDLNAQLGLFGAQVWLIRSLLQIKTGERSRLNPYMVRKLAAAAARLDESTLRQLLTVAAQLDGEVKAGRKEGVWAIEELIFRFK